MIRSDMQYVLYLFYVVFYAICICFKNYEHLIFEKTFDIRCKVPYNISFLQDNKWFHQHYCDLPLSTVLP